MQTLFTQQPATTAEERQERLAAYGKYVLDYNLSIAGTLSDDMYNYLMAQEVDQFVAIGAAREAVRLVLQALQYGAYIAGLDEDPRR